MGTRNLTMVIDKQGDLKVAQYGQWDGYPSGQGVIILEFAKYKENISKLENRFNIMKFYNECNDIDKYINEFVTKNIKTEKDMYFFNKLITRDLGGEILQSIINLDLTCLPKEMNNKIYLKNEIEFGKDSLMCEWAYCINLQTNKLEVFKGFNKDKSQEHERFKTTEEDVEYFKNKNYCYYGMQLIKEYDLDNLPTKEEFITELENNNEE